MPLGAQHRGKLHVSLPGRYLRGLRQGLSSLLHGPPRLTPVCHQLIQHRICFRKNTTRWRKVQVYQLSPPGRRHREIHSLPYYNGEGVEEISRSRCSRLREPHCTPGLILGGTLANPISLKTLEGLSYSFNHTINRTVLICENSPRASPPKSFSFSLCFKPPNGRACVI